MNPPDLLARTPKSVLRDAIDAEPEDASYEDILRELAFEQMMECGLSGMRAGRTPGHEEALHRIRSWRT